jgi:hypothetical protein
MVNVEVFLRLVVDINFELGDFVLCFCDHDKVVCWKDFELSTFVFILLSTNQTLVSLSKDSVHL